MGKWEKKHSKQSLVERLGDIPMRGSYKGKASKSTAGGDKSNENKLPICWGM